MKHGCMVLTLRLSSRRRIESRQTHHGRKKRVKLAAMSSPCWSFFFRHPRHCPQGIRTPSWSNRQCQVLQRVFEAAEGGHSARTSRQVEEQQLVFPPRQRARSHITRCSTMPDFHKHYSDSLPPPLHHSPCDFFIFPKMKLRLRGRRFDTTEEIHAESQEVIDTLTFENF